MSPQNLRNDHSSRQQPDQANNGGQPSRPEPDRSPEALRRNNLGAVFLGLMVISFIVTMYPLPGKLLAGVIAIVGVVWGIRFIIAATKAKQAGSWVMTGVLGILVCLYNIFGTAGMALMFPVQKQFEECTMNALTEQAQVSCQTNYKQGVDGLLSHFGGGQ